MNRCVLCGSSLTRGDFVACPTCSLVQKVPMPNVQEVAALYHEDFDHFAPYLEQMEVHRAYFRRILRDVILAHARIGIGIHKTKTDSRLRGNDKRISLLDIGCAMGALLEVARESGIDAIGVDISEDAVAYCKKKGLDVSHKWPKKEFDVITAFQIIEHERDPLGFMRRVYKLLKKGGLVILATPDAGGMWRKIMGKRWVGFTHPEHVVLLNFNSMRVLLEKSGFRDIEIRRDTPRPFLLSFALKRAADYFPAMAWVLKPLGRLFDRFKIINPINPWDDMIVYARK